jgi:hypothetical protein
MNSWFHVSAPAGNRPTQAKTGLEWATGRIPPLEKWLGWTERPSAAKSRRYFVWRKGTTWKPCLFRF